MNSRYPAASVLLNKLSLDMRKSLHKMQAYHTEEIILPNNVQHQCHSKKGKSRKLGKLL